MTGAGGRWPFPNAAALQGLSVDDLEREFLATPLARLGYSDLVGAVGAADQEGQFDAEEFRATLAENLQSGAFRLVLVLDEAPDELVRIAGYLERITEGLLLDLVTDGRCGSIRCGTRMRGLLDWARDLEGQGLARLWSTVGRTQDVLQVRVRGEQVGLVTIWGRHAGPALSVWPTVFERRAPVALVEITRLVGSDSLTKPLRDIADDLLAALGEAYREAAGQ